MWSTPAAHFTPMHIQGILQAHELQHHDTDALNMLYLCATWADAMITVLFQDFSANSQGTATEMNEKDLTKLLCRKSSRQPAASL